MINDNSITIFTDGSSRGNPGPGGYAAIISYQEPNDNHGEIHDSRFTIQELGGREDHTTNNRMELQAVISAFSFISEKLIANSLKLKAFTDSSYVVNGITKWIYGWQKNGWRTSTKDQVENQDLWERLLAVTKNKEIEWNVLPGHSGIRGNERCDEIATTYADGDTPILYNGFIENYSLGESLYDISYKKDSFSNRSKKEDRSRSKAKAYSYVSSVDGVVMTHKTWAECEARVKGKRNARFKKTLSATEEVALKDEWGSM